MNVKTVVIVNDFDYVEGGASKVAIDTARLLSKKGIKVYFFSATNQKNEHIDGIEYVSTKQGESLKDKNRFRGAMNNLYNKKAKNDLTRLLDKLDRETTVVHVHGWTKGLSSSVFSAAFKKNFKVVLTAHDYFLVCPNGGFFNFRKNEICELKPWQYLFVNCDSRNYGFQLFRMIRLFIQNVIVGVPRKLKNIIAVSEFSAKILKRHLKDNVNITVIQNPVDKLGPKIDTSKNNIFLYVGRLSKEKGIKIFCEAVTEAGVKAIVVGDGDLKKELEKKYKNIEFVGWQNRDGIYKCMKKAKALVFPSLWYETAGLVVLEAIRVGLSVIVNRNCAASGYIENKEFLYDGSAAGLVKKITTVGAYDKNDYFDKFVSNDEYAERIMKIGEEIYE